MGVNQVQYWVLRERATKLLMPRVKCGTRAEFTDTGPPRLFTTPGAAKQALDCWRMGLWRLTGDEDGCYPEPANWSGNAEIAARRRATEVDIVPMSLLSVPR